MRNEELWQCSKFVLGSSGLKVSDDPKQVAPSSRLIGNLAARGYETAIRSHAAGHLLDLGCGHVPLYGIYRKYVKEITCVDWANTSHPSPHLDIETNLAEPLPLADSAYDTILMTDVLEHLPEPARIFAEMSRLLRPGGKVILGVPFLYWIHEDPYDYYRYTEFALKRLARESGLSVLELSPYGGLPEVLADMTGKMLNFVPSQVRRITSPLLNLVTKYFFSAGPLHRISLATSRKFPLGYVMVAQK